MKTQAAPRSWDYLAAAMAATGRALPQWAASGRVDPQARAALEAAHAAICRREDLPALQRWLEAPPGSARERQCQGGARALLRLLEMLGRAGLPPFHAPLLSNFAPRPRQAARRPDSMEADEPAFTTAGATGAADVPQRIRLHYLVQCARRLNLGDDGAALADFVDHVSQPQFDALAAAADAMRRRGDLPALRHAAQLAEPDGGREAKLLRSLLHVMDALDIF